MSKNKKEPKSLLEKFLFDKRFNYSEPQKKDIPRGDPIGFSKQKYFASLLLLTNLKQKQIAETLKISHGVLRKWNTEEDFKAMVDKHCQEFLKIVLEFINKIVEHSQKQTDEWKKSDLSHSFSEFMRKNDDNEILRNHAFSDSKGYSKKLLNTFSNWIKENEFNSLGIENPNYASRMEKYFCINGYILRLNPLDRLGREVMKSIDEKMLGGAISSLESILSSNKRITKNQRKQMQINLEVIKQITTK